jgi:hypothetical protein
VSKKEGNEYILTVLDRADELMSHVMDRIYGSYVAAGAARQESSVVKLRELVSEPPAWVDRYVDLTQRMRANPFVAGSLIQTAELACFDALYGDTAYKAKAFDHLFTREHQHLLAAAIKCLREIIGSQLTDTIQPVDDLDFDRTAPSLPDRTGYSTAADENPSVATPLGNAEQRGG